MTIAIRGRCRPREDGVNHLLNQLERSRKFLKVNKCMKLASDRRSFRILVVHLPADLPAADACGSVRRIIKTACVNMHASPTRTSGLSSKDRNLGRRHPRRSTAWAVA